jgi:REP element-mobilizing transposase RayT
MPDHIHLLLKLRNSGSLSAIVEVLKATIRNDASHVTNVVWMRGFHERIKREYESSDEYVKYITQNPVRAGLVAAAESYPFLGRPDCWF